MKKFVSFVAGALFVWLVILVFAASVGEDAGVTLMLSFKGILQTDMVVDNNGNPVLDPSGNQWQAKSKLERDLGEFARHVYEMTEGKHYIRQIMIIDQDRARDQADIRWDNDPTGGSTGALNGWSNSSAHINLRRGWRQEIDEVIAHEFGHYFYGLSDEYARSDGYYQGHFQGTGNFQVNVLNNGCVNTIMQLNHPYQFCDTTDHSLDVSYVHPASGNTISETLTPGLLTDGNANNDGPINNWIDQPFAIDGWSVAEMNQVDLVGHHTAGNRPSVNFANMPALKLIYVEQPSTAPGRIMLLDRSGSMAHQEFGIPASQYVQEAGLYLYHSSGPSDYVGAYVYDSNTDVLFAYDQYNSANTLVNYYQPNDLTDICKALKTGLDALETEHGAGNVAGGELYLLSDGKQTTGNNLWDQVTRAKNLGVKIHTFSYGAADQATMSQISSETSGEEFLMSENDSGLMNLKIRIVKSLSKIRGWTEVFDYYGPLVRSGTTSRGVEFMTVRFDVPFNSKDVRFYVFPQQPTTDNYNFALRYAPTAYEVRSSTSPIANKGRFRGERALNPAEGTWTADIYADLKNKKLPAGNFQIMAYVDNGEVEAKVWVDRHLVDITKDLPRIPIYGYVRNKYLLTGMKVDALIQDPHGVLLATVPMVDDGKQGDRIKEDGLYTGFVNSRDLVGKTKYMRFTIKVDYEVGPKSYPAPNQEIEPRMDPRMAFKAFRPTKYKATAATMFGATRDLKEPRLDLLKFGKSVIRRGRKYESAFSIVNAFPSEKDLRVNLGQGIRINSIKTTPDRGTYIVNYAVAPNAKRGKRDLLVQFYGWILKSEKAIEVR